MERFGWMRAAPWVLAVVGTGCAMDFDPPSRVQDVRVLAMVADPVEAAEGDVVNVQAAVFVPGDAPATLAWSFCPVSPGATAGFACLAPACEFPLEADPADPSRVAIEPFALLGACLAALAAEAGAGAGEPPPGGPVERPESIDGVVRLRVEVEGLEPREAVLRLTLRQDPPAAVNRNPAVLGVDADGVAPDGEGAFPAVKAGEERSFRVRVDPASLDAFTDGSGEARVEPAITSVYATGGTFEKERAEGTDVVVRWTADDLEPGAADVRFWFVVRDLRGGQAVAGPYRSPVLPSP